MRILRLKDVELKTGLRHAAIYKRIAANTFPKRLPLGTRAVGWLESEVDEWIARCVEARLTDDPSTRNPRKNKRVAA